MRVEIHVHKYLCSVIDPVDTNYDTIGNVTNGNVVVHRESKPVTLVVAASSSERHINSGPLLPPRNSDAHLLENGSGILPIDQHLDDHHGNVRTSKGGLCTVLAYLEINLYFSLVLFCSTITKYIL